MNTILQGDCREVLKTLDAASVHCCVTSPPYWGLRDYGTAEWEGGSEDCDHQDDAALAERLRQKKSMIACGERIDGSTRTRIHDEEIGKGIQHRYSCPKCGATRIDKQLGLEKTPDEYVAKLVEVFREVRRVLRDDGTLWLNLGDSYASNWGMGAKRDSSWWSTRSGELEGKGWGDVETTIPPNSFKKGRADGLKVKDLCGIPWLVAFALRADGWYLRQDIIWAKPNPMPESVTDRCTKAHEYIFLMSKSERYFYNAEAIKEESVCDSLPGRNMTDTRETYGVQNGGNSGLLALRNKLRDQGETDPTRNRRSVWTVTTKPYREAHFATFPPDLILPCILAGCPEGGTVLDPFLGSGTTALVAQKNGCDCIGIELNPEYVELAKRRIEQRSIFA